MTAIGPATAGTTAASPASRPGGAGPDAFAQTLRTLLQRADQTASDAQAGDAAMFNERGFFTPPEIVAEEPIAAPPALAAAPTLQIVAEAPTEACDPGAVVSAAPSREMAERAEEMPPARLPVAPSIKTATTDVRLSVPPPPAHIAAGNAPEPASSPRRGAAMPVRPPVVAVAILAGGQGASVSLRTPALGDEDRETLHGAVAALLARHGIALGTLRINGRAPDTGRGG